MDSDFQIYAAEIDRVQGACYSIVHDYVNVRGAVEAYMANVACLTNLHPQITSHINLISQLQLNELLMLTWKIMENCTTGEEIPGEIAARTLAKTPRAMGDGGSTLPRLAALFRNAASQYSELLSDHRLSRDAAADRQVAVRHQAAIQRLCGKIDELARSDTFKHVNVTRHEGRADSVCLNSSGRLAKWISASIMLLPGLASAR